MNIDYLHACWINTLTKSHITEAEATGNEQVRKLIDSKIYDVAFKRISNKDAQTLYDTLKTIHEIFEEAKIHYIAEDYTLLGAERHGGLIPWIGAGSVAFDNSEEGKLRNLEQALNNQGYVLVSWFGGYKIYHRDNQILGSSSTFPSVNLIPMHKEADGSWHYQRKQARKIWPKNTFTDEDFTQKKLMPFGSFQIWGPKDSQKHLDNVYGKNWPIIAHRSWHHKKNKSHKIKDALLTSKNPAPYFDYSEGNAIILPNKIVSDMDFRGEVKLPIDSVWIAFHAIAQGHPNVVVPKLPYIYIPNNKKINDFYHHIGKATIDDVSANKEATHFFYPLLIDNEYNSAWKHWVLVHIDTAKRSVAYYDSKFNYGHHKFNCSVMEDIASQLSAKDADKTPFVFEKKISRELQIDKFECGIWICYFLEKLLANPSTDFNQMDENKAGSLMANYRKKVQDLVLKTDVAKLWANAF